MQHDQFIGQVQHRAQLSSRGDAERAVRATLETLAERLVGGEAKDLAAQLPRELGEHLLRAGPLSGERFSLHDFYRRVAEREGIPDVGKAAYHARVVVEVLGEAVSLGEMRDVRAQLPIEFDPLFAGTGFRRVELC
jgi:uncharacterized protein (DUF2267 family)